MGDGQTPVVAPLATLTWSALDIVSSLHTRPSVPRVALSPLHRNTPPLAGARAARVSLFGRTKAASRAGAAIFRALEICMARPVAFQGRVQCPYGINPCRNQTFSATGARDPF